MIKGMTGFGISSFSYKGRKYVVNIKSVNHKFLDFVINLPDGIFSLDAKIKKTLSRSLNRGRVMFQLVSLEPCPQEPVLNKKVLTKYFNLIRDIRRSLKIKQEISLHDLIGLPEVIYFKKSSDCLQKQFHSVLNKNISKALNSLTAMRRQEGKLIGADLLKRFNKISQKLMLIKKRLMSIIKEQKTKLGNDELKDFLKNYNIEEEVVRLGFHVQTFKNTIRQSGPLGKILDFIAQEMQREVNTLSAKIRDSVIAYHSVLIKDEIEKVREQLQNVE